MEKLVRVITVLALLCLISSQPATALYESSSDVFILTPANFKSKAVEAKGIVLVEFYANWCGHCKSLAPDWEKAATALKGIVRVAALDADTHKSLAQEYGIQGFPTIKVFGLGKSPIDYKGPRDAKGIVEYALQQAKTLALNRLKGKSSSSSSSGGKKSEEKEKASIELTPLNFEEQVLKSNDLWLVEFYAPWCGHCKKLAPEWKTAAKRLKGKVKLGQVDCDAHKDFMSKYDIGGFPTILVFGADKEHPTVYQGAREASVIESFALEQLETAGIPAEVVELTGPEVMESHCSSAAICFLAFLPDILDSKADGRSQYLDILKHVAAKFKSYGYVWAEAGKQPSLEQAVGVGGYGYPALVALNVKKAVFLPQRSAFEPSSVLGFVREASQGGKGNLPLGSDFTVGKTAAWDGKDGEPIIDEEFSLDDLMDDTDNPRAEL